MKNRAPTAAMRAGQRGSAHRKGDSFICNYYNVNLLYLQVLIHVLT